MAESSEAPGYGDAFDAIVAIARDELGIRTPLSPDSDLLRDLRLDSISVMTLVVALEDRFQITLSEEDSAGVRAVGELATLIDARRRAAS